MNEGRIGINRIIGPETQTWGGRIQYPISAITARMVDLKVCKIHLLGLILSKVSKWSQMKKAK